MSKENICANEGRGFFIKMLLRTIVYISFQSHKELNQASVLLFLVTFPWHHNYKVNTVFSYQITQFLPKFLHFGIVIRDTESSLSQVNLFHSEPDTIIITNLLVEIFKFYPQFNSIIRIFNIICDVL